MLSGKQRRHWHYNASLVSGGDIELALDEWLKGLSSHQTYLTLASFVNKHEADEVVMADASHRLRLPRYVNAFDAGETATRSLQLAGGICAWKSQDPCSTPLVSIEMVMLRCSPGRIPVEE